MIPETNSVFSGAPSMELIKKKRNAIKTVIRKLGIATLPKCNSTDMFNSSFNQKSFPGFSYKEYLEFNTKEEAFEVASYVAEERWNYISSCSKEGKEIRRNAIFLSTYVVSAQNNKDAWYDGGETATSRAVHMPEYHCELQSAPWIDQITEHIREKQNGPIYIGNSQSKYERLAKDMKDSVSMCEGDVRRFDSSLFITDTIIPTSIGRLYYDLADEEIDNHFIAIFDNSSIADYYTPGGHIYRIINGLSSRVKSTSIFGSIINFVNLCYGIGNRNSKKFKFSIGGDDFLFGAVIKLNRKFLKEFKDRCSGIGYTFKKLAFKNFNGPNSKRLPVFYKYNIHRGEPIVTAADMLERVFLPSNKRYKNNTEVFYFDPL